MKVAHKIENYRPKLWCVLWGEVPTHLKWKQTLALPWCLSYSHIYIIHFSTTLKLVFISQWTSSLANMKTKVLFFVSVGFPCGCLWMCLVPVSQQSFYWYKTLELRQIVDRLRLLYLKMNYVNRIKGTTNCSKYPNQNLIKKKSGTHSHVTLKFRGVTE